MDQRYVFEVLIRVCYFTYSNTLSSHIHHPHHPLPGSPAIGGLLAAPGQIKNGVLMSTKLLPVPHVERLDWLSGVPGDCAH